MQLKKLLILVKNQNLKAQSQFILLHNYKLNFHLDKNT